ncbi:MAG: carbohydrate ABC transporter permease [Cetobacterium sp.]|uniref:carbohydrate ABC transporter permease n=1 Tax=Cetobacterium sp. TaxID=2071632 RepID=UPI003F3FB82C
MNSKNKLGYLFIFPSILILAIFVFYPIFLTFKYSLYYFKLTRLSKTHFIFLDNYKNIILSREFISALYNTLFIIFILLILGLLSSIFVALILNKKNKLNKFLTAIAIIPWALPPIVNGLIWKFIFYPEVGFFNKLLYFFKITNEPINWLNDKYGSLIIIAIIVAWRVVPFSAIILLANMQSISEDVYEAADIDGATSFQKFFHITIPLLIPSLIISITNFILTGITVFDEVISLVGYRKLGETLSVYNYNETFSFLNIGYGSAITYIIMILSGIFGFIYIKALERKN